MNEAEGGKKEWTELRIGRHSEIIVPVQGNSRADNFFFEELSRQRRVRIFMRATTFYLVAVSPGKRVEVVAVWC